MGALLYITGDALLNVLGGDGAEGQDGAVAANAYLLQADMCVRIRAQIFHRL